MNYLYDGMSLQNGRISNMDSILLSERTIDGQNAVIAVVCDGVGSMSDGAFAASIAVRMLSLWFGCQKTVERIGLRMRDTVSDINAHIVAEAQINNLNTATTLSALLLVGDLYYIVHVGDSRIYSVDNGTLSQLTKDDISELGKLTACIGKKENVFLYYSEGTVGNKVFLLCSDGLYKRIDTGLIFAKMNYDDRKSLRKSIEFLTQYVIDNNERDNISVAVVKKLES